MRRVVEVAGRRLSLSNLEKDLYPSYGFTKPHVLEYYRRMSRFILPHLKDRALTLKRYPDWPSWWKIIHWITKILRDSSRRAIMAQEA